MRSHNVQLSDFTTEYTEKDRLILIEAFKPGTAELLGFIRFAYDRDGFSIGGGLKIANFNASLQGYTLRTGGTTKSGDGRQTGQFGEGMKLSALVFRRSGYKFHIESTGFKWDFTYQQRELVCKLSRISEERLNGLARNARGLPRTAEAHPWEDVCVVIGAPGKTRDISGQPARGKRIHVIDFREWLKVTLDIKPPTAMIKTSKGYLIREPSYSGQLYLQGLLFPSGATIPQPYQFGYNFLTGSTTRDRTSLAGSNEEGQKVADIWAAAILEDESNNSVILTEYTQLVLNSLNNIGDVMLSKQRNTLRREIAQKVWRQMLSINKGQNDRNAFYYVAKGKDVRLHLLFVSVR